MTQSETVCRRRKLGITTYTQPCQPGYTCTSLDRKVSVCVKDENEKITESKKEAETVSSSSSFNKSLPKNALPPGLSSSNELPPDLLFEDKSRCSGSKIYN